MQLSLLHLDDALVQQADFIRTCDQLAAQHVEVNAAGADVRLWGKDTALSALRNTMMAQLASSPASPRLTFMGSGDFHHISALLIEAALRDVAAGEEITVIHFDNHPDWVHQAHGMHCGSWVNRAQSLPQVRKVITIGVCSPDLRLPEMKGANLDLLRTGTLELYPYDHAPSVVRKAYGEGASYTQKNGALHWRTIEAMGEEAFVAHVLARIETQKIYMTIDKDVLTHDDAITNWDQGKMRLPYLRALIRAIGKEHTIIGADVNGDYSTPHYTGSLWTRLLKHGEILLDQPRRAPDAASAIRVNSATNLLLLNDLMTVMV